jgi:hypothetical protein
VNSLVSSIVGGVTDSSRHLFGAARFETLKSTLARATKAKTILNGGVLGRDAVKSPLVFRMVDGELRSLLCARLQTAASRALPSFVCTESTVFVPIDLSRSLPLQWEAWKENVHRKC